MGVKVFERYDAESREAIYVEKYVGAVVGSVCRVERVMSDVWDDVRYAVVLDEKGDLREVCGAFEIDASDEVKAAAEAVKAAAKSVELARSYRESVAASRESLMRVVRGRVVKIVKKRAKNSGKQGEVFWIGEGAYGRRCGFKMLDADGEEKEVVWTALSNVEVVAGLRDSDLADMARMESAAEDAALEAFKEVSAARALAKAALADAAFRAKVAEDADAVLA